MFGGLGCLGVLGCLRVLGFRVFRGLGFWDSEALEGIGLHRAYRTLRVQVLGLGVGVQDGLGSVA